MVISVETCPCDKIRQMFFSLRHQYAKCNLKGKLDSNVYKQTTGVKCASRYISAAALCLCCNLFINRLISHKQFKISSIEDVSTTFQHAIANNVEASALLTSHKIVQCRWYFELFVWYYPILCDITLSLKPNWWISWDIWVVIVILHSP